MFEALGKRFYSIINKLSGFGHLTEKNIEEALREVRLALLEADVHVGVVKSFLEKTKERSLGSDILKKLNSTQQFFNIVHEELTAVLGKGQKSLELGGTPPHVFLIVGLQGSGKTTTTAKLAHYFQKNGKRPFLVPADINRPAAIEQLQILANSIAVPCFKTVPLNKPCDTLQRALDEARDKFCDVILVDSAGRLHVDDELLTELKATHEELKLLLKKGLSKGACPELRTLLVVDAMMGQMAVQAASRFHEFISVDGLILTKLDGDAKGGAAFSVQGVVGCPIYFTGVGEKISDLEPFDPERLVSRLLDRGDILSLVEKAKEVIHEGEAQKFQEKVFKQQFNLENFGDQLKQMKKMGSLSSLIGFLPGGQAMNRKMDMEVVEKDLRMKEAIINSMTLKERRTPEILNGSRRARIARGSGTEVSQVNRLIREFAEIKKMMKKFSGKGGGALQGLKGMFGF